MTMPATAAATSGITRRWRRAAMSGARPSASRAITAGATSGSAPTSRIRARRASRRGSSISPGSSGVIDGLLGRHPSQQLLAGLEHAALHRALGDAEHVAGLAVAEPEDLDHEHRLAQLGAERRQCLVELDARGGVAA